VATTPDGYFQDILVTLADKLGFPFQERTPTSGANELRRIVAVLSASTFYRDTCLFIDEVPTADSTVLAAFAESATALVNHYATSSGGATQLRFVFATQPFPRDAKSPLSGKFLAHFAEIELSDWAAPELESLIEKLCTSLALDLRPDEMASIISGASGSPRYLKAIMRNLLRLRAFGRMDISEAVGAIKRGNV
jgi:hypothetical protein